MNKILAHKQSILVVLSILVMAGAGTVVILSGKKEPTSQVFVQIDYPGATAKVIEQTLTNPVEKTLTTLPDLQSIESRTSDGKVMVTLSFMKSAPVYQQLVRQKIDELAANSDDQMLQELLSHTYIKTASETYKIISLAGKYDYSHLQEFSQVITDQLKKNQFIDSVEVDELTKPAVFIKYDLAALNQNKLNISQTNSEIKRYFTAAAGGVIANQTITALPAITQVEEVKQIAVYNPNPISLPSIAAIETGQTTPLKYRKLGLMKDGAVEFLNSLDITVATSLTPGDLQKVLSQTLDDHKDLGLSGVVEQDANSFKINFQLPANYFEREQALSKLESTVSDTINTNLAAAYYSDDALQIELAGTADRDNVIKQLASKLPNQYIIDQPNLAVEIYSDDLSSLQAAEISVVKLLQDNSINYSRQTPINKYITVTPSIDKLVENNIDLDKFYDTLQALYGSKQIAQFTTDKGITVYVYAGLNANFTDSLSDLQNLVIYADKPVKISDVAVVDQVNAGSVIEHKHGMRCVLMNLYVPSNLDNIKKMINEMLVSSRDISKFIIN